MSNYERRKRLVLKPVGMEHLTQYNELLRYVFQVTNQELFKSGYEEGELIKSKQPILQRADVIGWFNAEKLVSQLSIYPCEVNIHGKIFKMGGLTGVGTYPEYAKLSLMTDLIKVGLQMMRDKNQLISYLYPYSVPYYRGRGWEIISERLRFTVRDSQFPAVVEMPGFVERLPVDHADVLNTYDRFARQNHGAMLRGKDEWEEYWRWENEEERTAAVYYDENGAPTGYMLYWIEEDILHIKEIIYLQQEARIGLWNFISAHFSMVESVKGNNFKNAPIAFLLNDSQIVETITPYFMGRIVDVAAFLKDYPFADKSSPLHFIVSDPMVEWNNGVFGLHWVKGKAHLTSEPVGKPVTLNIRTLTALLMSFRRPSYFHEINHLQTDSKTLAALENIIPDTTPYFSDYF